MPPTADPDTIETGRLLLRRFTVADASDFMPLVSLPEVLRYVAEPALRSVKEVRDLLLAHPLRDYRLYGYGRLACIEKSTGRLIGFCGLKYLDDMGETDIGYRFVPDAWGRGYATESAAAVIAVQAPRLGLTRLIGLAEPANLASLHVLQKLGMVFEGRITDLPHGDLDLYAMEIGAG